MFIKHLYPIKVSSNETSSMALSKDQEEEELTLRNSTGDAAQPEDQEQMPTETELSNLPQRPQRQAAIVWEEIRRKSYM